jgi:photosystem II stability/assembly factor-like uncharacterized protein
MNIMCRFGVPGVRAAARPGVAALALTVTLAAVPVIVVAQRGAEKANVTVNPALFSELRYRSLGFSRGGRATAVTGVPSQPLTFYFGSTGGGVWKTTSGGGDWTNVSDGFFEAGSIGAIAVGDTDPNVIYVGTGSACPRGNVSIGVGMYKSTDAGKTWKHIGLRTAGQIGRVRIHPQNHDLVYVAVLGNVFGASPDRGVFRSRDGGQNWEKVLYVNERTGAIDLTMDATNPRVLYAALWTTERKPWTIESGSLDGGIFKSSDGGDTWKKLTKGLPTDVLVGKIGVTVSPANPDRLWAQVEAAGDRGGVYRSDDGGESWTRVNSQRMLQQRAWYYTHIFADPKDADTVYALNTGFYKSIDGGRTFQSYSTPHGDNHDLWINPHNPLVMINSNDGGANVSSTGGTTWSTQMNQPTAEIYRVTVDTRFPYRVYGAQQDNSTTSVPTFSQDMERGMIDFYSVGGGESGHIAVDPRNPNIVYAGSHSGSITRMDTSTRLSESVRAYPELETGERALDMKYRVQWNAPIRISPHNPDIVYHTSQHVHRTKDAGHSWEVIGPDLTRNDKSKQDYSGGEGITRDSTTVEVYDTIFAFEESPQTPGLLWAGSDDGLVHISRDDGKTWTNITPREMPEWGCVNMIDLSAHDPGRAHIAVYKYRQNDFTPYIFQTSDYGKTWRRLTTGANGIPPTHFVRVVREDPDRQGLLYAGTEYGMHISFDDGTHWQPFQLNLPATPVTDLMVYRKDLVVSTQGRAFWVLDDLSVVHQVSDKLASAGAHLFKPRDAYRLGVGPASIFYSLADAPKQPVTIEVSDAKGAVVARYLSGAAGAPAGGGRRGGPSAADAAPKAGLNRFDWEMRHDPLFEVPRGAVLWGYGRSGAAGPRVVPGQYQVKVSSGSWSQVQTFQVKGDPRIKMTQAEYEEQLKLAREVGAEIDELYDNLLKIRDVKQQAEDIGQRLRKAGLGEEAAAAARTLAATLAAIEGELTQRQGEGGQDALNFPSRLDGQFLTLFGDIAGDEARVSKGAYQRFEDLKPQLAKLLGQLEQVLASDLGKFNELARKGGQTVIVPGTGRRTTSGRG